jgi:hypothetical protein
VPFWAPTSLITNSTSRGFVELYDDRVAFDFEVVSTWGPRSLRRGGMLIQARSGDVGCSRSKLITLEMAG